MINSDMTTSDTTPVYRDPGVYRDDRVADLLARMTIDEKLAQLGSAWVFQLAGRDGFDADRGRRRCSPTASATSPASAARAASTAREAAPARQRRSSGTCSSTPGSASRRSSTRRSAPG